MGETKWTPGPWALAPCSHGGAILRRGADDVRGHPQTHVQIVPIEDARLIAAAPDLYEALAGLANSDAQDEDHPCFCGRDHWARTPRPPHARYCTAARAALAKARGETP